MSVGEGAVSTEAGGWPFSRCQKSFRKQRIPQAPEAAMGRFGRVEMLVE